VKFATWRYANREEAGILSDDMKSVHSFESLGLRFNGIQDYIARRDDASQRTLSEAGKKDGIPIGGVTLLAPIPRPRHDIICLGLNYADHAEESARFSIREDTEAAIYFSKRVIRALGPDGVIENHFSINSRLDYEAELAVIIGKDTRNIRPEEVPPHIFGICCFNDLSARDLQSRHKQWYFGKSLDTLTAMGPYIVTLDEFDWPLSLDICSRVNGETRQHSNTGNLIHPVEEIVAELASGMTLDPGSVIATGTPAGVGAGFTPHRCLAAGDVCEIEIEGCGVLRNTVSDT